MLSCKILSFLLVFRITKEYHQDFRLLCIIDSLYITFFGEKRFTLNAFSLDFQITKKIPKFVFQIFVLNQNV
jgi:hypothetical protein